MIQQILFTIGAILTLAPSKKTSKLNQEETKELKVSEKKKTTLLKFNSVHMKLIQGWTVTQSLKLLQNMKNNEELGEGQTSKIKLLKY